jgi:hypothetical protein
MRRAAQRGNGLQDIRQAGFPQSRSRTMTLASIRREYSTMELILINHRIDRAE